MVGAPIWQTSASATSPTLRYPLRLMEWLPCVLCWTWAALIMGLFGNSCFAARAEPMVMNVRKSVYDAFDTSIADTVSRSCVMALARNSVPGSMAVWTRSPELSIADTVNDDVTAFDVPRFSRRVHLAAT
eukprot:UN1274